LKNSREVAQFERSRFSIGTLAMQPSSSWRNRAISLWASSFRRMQCHSMCHPAVTRCSRWPLAIVSPLQPVQFQPKFVEMAAGAACV